MVASDDVLVALLRLVDRLPLPEAPSSYGRPVVYTERLFLKALVIMVVRRYSRVHELLSALEEPAPQMRTLHALLCEEGRYPSRRTWERRLARLPDTLSSQIGLLGRYLVFLLSPWQDKGRAVAIDSTLLRSLGPVWHNKHKKQGLVPHTRIDTEAAWTYSPWHGWVYGYKLHLTACVADFWVPVGASLTPASTADNTEAERLLQQLPPSTRFVLGDQLYGTERLREVCQSTGRCLVTSRKGPRPHTDHGAQARRVFHRLRSVAIENLNGHFKDLFGLKEHVPTKGFRNTARFVLGAVFVYQLTLWLRHEYGIPLQYLSKGFKPFLRAA